MPVTAIDAPVGGVNAFDSVDSMPPTDAVLLTNWICRSGFLESRPGTTLHVDVGEAPVETLTSYKGSKTPFQMIAAMDGTLYNVSESPATVISSGHSNDRWQTAMINDYLIFANGVDGEYSYDGTTFQPLEYTITQDAWDVGTEYFPGDLVSAGGKAWECIQQNTGEDPQTSPDFWEEYYGPFIGVINFKGRAIYWKPQDLSFWYSEAGSFQGILQEFDLGPVLQRGGYIKSVFTWTVDSGTGPDDMLVFAFNTGELLLYQGDDPGNIGFFEQVGRFEMPDPLSIRGNMKYGSDVIIMTRNGYVNLATVLKDDQQSDYPAFSRKIARIVFDLGNRYNEFYGHECIQLESGLLLFNVPTSLSTAEQWVINGSTGAWSRLTNLNAVAWCTFNDETYYSSFDGKVYKIGGTSDSGEPIPLDALPAYNYYGDQGSQKQITAVQILSTFPAPKLIKITGYADFDVPKLQNLTTPPGSIGGTAWNEVLWNTTQWNRSGGTIATTTKGWQNCHAFGYAVTAAVQMKIQSQTVIWRQTGIRYRTAGAQ